MSRPGALPSLGLRFAEKLDEVLFCCGSMIFFLSSANRFLSCLDLSMEIRERKKDDSFAGEALTVVLTESSHFPPDCYGNFRIRGLIKLLEAPGKVAPHLVSDRSLVHIASNIKLYHNL
jgi:hypothetical protein